MFEYDILIKCFSCVCVDVIRSVLLFAFVGEASLCSGQQLVKRLTHNWLGIRDSLGCSALSGTSESPPPRLREHCGRGGGKNVRARGRGSAVWSTIFQV